MTLSELTHDAEARGTQGNTVMSTLVVSNDLASKIATLVEERGWNQEDFARIANLNRHTVRQILHAEAGRRLRNATVSACADTLGLTVNELRTLPLERLLPRMHGKPAVDEEAYRMLQTQATLPELMSWLERNEPRAAEFTCEEIGELLAVQEPDGVLARLGVEQYVDFLERRRKLVQQVRAIASTEYLDMLEQFVGLIHEKVQKNSSAYRSRLV